MNKPYVKQLETVNNKQEILNPITVDKPYLHQFGSSRGKSKRKYTNIHNHVTGQFIMKLKQYGNNRANTCKRGKMSRIILN